MNGGSGKVVYRNKTPESRASGRERIAKGN
jgi:hypothetical protein